MAVTLFAAAPPRVEHLVATSLQSTRVGIQWTMPAPADGTTIVSNDFRISTAPISTLSWNRATVTKLTYLDDAIGSHGATMNSYITNLTGGTRYYIAMKTRNNLGQWSALSKALVVNTPSATRPLTLAWDPNPVNEAVEGYIAYMETDDTVTTNDVGNITSASFTVTEGVSYTFYVTAYNSAGESDASESLSYTP